MSEKERKLKQTREAEEQCNSCNNNCRLYNIKDICKGWIKKIKKEEDEV